MSRCFWNVKNLSKDFVHFSTYTFNLLTISNWVKTLNKCFIKSLNLCIRRPIQVTFLSSFIFISYSDFLVLQDLNFWTRSFKIGRKVFWRRSVRNKFSLPAYSLQKVSKNLCTDIESGLYFVVLRHVKKPSVNLSCFCEFGLCARLVYIRGASWLCASDWKVVFKSEDS